MTNKPDLAYHNNTSDSDSGEKLSESQPFNHYQNIIKLLEWHIKTLNDIDNGFGELIFNNSEDPINKASEIKAIYKLLDPLDKKLCDLTECYRNPEFYNNRITTIGQYSIPVFINKTYLLLKHMTNGHFGMIFLAREISLDREVVIKFPIIDSLESKDKLDDFVEEGKVLSFLSSYSSYIVDIHALSSVDVVFDCNNNSCDLKLPFIVMEKMDYTLADDLAEDIYKYIFDPHRSINIVKQLARALHVAHSPGRLIHGDIKPNNILLKKVGSGEVQVKLGDFGLAQAIEFSTPDEILKYGNIDYIAPERLDYKACDVRTDIYGLGVILYIMLTGQNPFYRSGSPIDKMSAILSGDKLSPEILNPELNGYKELVNICKKAMAVKPEDRFKNANQFADAIDRFYYTSNEITRDLFNKMGFKYYFSLFIKAFGLLSILIVIALLILILQHPRGTKLISDNKIIPIFIETRQSVDSAHRQVRVELAEYIDALKSGEYSRSYEALGRTKQFLSKSPDVKSDLAIIIPTLINIYNNTFNFILADDIKSVLDSIRIDYELSRAQRIMIDKNLGYYQSDN